MGFPIATTVSAVSAAASTIAAFAAYHAARKSNSASEQANATAEVVAGIERDRRHTELRPILEIAAPRSATDPDVLRFRFTGPDELEPLGPLTVSITIRDDKDRSNDPVLGGGPSREEVAAQIWGPWRLSPSVDDADRAGRAAIQRTVTVGEELLSTIERSLAPHWYGGGQPAWERHYEQASVRLRIEVTVTGYRPWVFLREIQPWVGRGVELDIERGSGSLYLLRNTGTAAATGVTVADGPGVDDRPQGVTIAPKEAVRMVMTGSLAGPVPTELRVTWDGRSDPLTLPMPPQ